MRDSKDLYRKIIVRSPTKGKILFGALDFGLMIQSQLSGFFGT